jgi:small subunit ribosomal protein SAe
MFNCIQPIKESALGNIPTIAFCDTDSPMRYVDIGIPANNKGKQSIGCLYWLLARMVLQMRGTILPGRKWEIMVSFHN